MKPKAPSRDSVTTINEDGSRYIVHPSDVSGRFALLRRLVGWLLIAVYVLLPWIPINGAPAVFLNVAERRFHLLGLTLVAQDLWLLFFCITGLGFTLFFTTALLGRIWCGWACPQTVFLDMVFRRVERLIDGDAPARRRLENAPWTPAKVFQRALKHGIFLACSLAVAHIFISYFVSLPKLYAMMHSAPAQNWGVFVFVMALSGILYFNFAWFREQFCIVMCPYGRLQSALVDDDTINVGYDERRGEPRGKPGSANAGDCIDCRRCVQVCPTGIDIRQGGLQLECIACTACIDACDQVMTRLHRPRGLVRYDSLSAFGGKKRRILRPRTVVYAVLMLIGGSVFSFAITKVKPVTFSILRMPGAPYYRDGEELRNNYFLRLINKRVETGAFEIEIVSSEPGLHIAGADANGRLTVAVPGNQEIQTPVVAQLPKSEFDGQFDIRMTVHDQTGSVLVSRTIPFLGPFRQGNTQRGAP